MIFFLRSGEFADGVEQSARDLLAKRHRHDVLEQALRQLEQDETIDSAGYGGIPNILGEMELDAAFMDGNTRLIGAVAAVKNFLPARLARRVMEKALHVLLVGYGAEQFARECGLPAEPTLAAGQLQRWKREVEPLLGEAHAGALAELVARLATPRQETFDTIIMVASDGEGLSCASTTSGWPYKYPGRIGDTPCAGAGFYVDSRFGWCGCTHTGEMSMRAGTARYVVSLLESGLSVPAAVDCAMQNLATLSGGWQRGLTLYAVDPSGDARVVAVNIAAPVCYWYWREGMHRPERRQAETIRSTPRR